MACILKIPNEDKGVVTFTTQERDKLIFSSPSLQSKIGDLKDRWVVGLHHNWHDYNFQYNPLFDFSMAGEGDLRGNFPLVEMDACNFIPPCYKYSEKKIWDILYVARGVSFKRLPLFFQTIKELYRSQATLPKVLLICPIGDESVSEGEVHKLYNNFTDEEKEVFTLIAPTHSYPFPYSSEVLASFYSHSKIFVHFADTERRCRATANAWAAEMPVVCRDDPASILPKKLKEPPFYYRVEHDGQYIEKIALALNEYEMYHRGLKYDFGKVKTKFSTKYTIYRLIVKIEKLFDFKSKNNCSLGWAQLKWNLNNGDIRLGRHHSISVGRNKVDVSLDTFILSLYNDELLKRIIHPNVEDPEKFMEELISGN